MNKINLQIAKMDSIINKCLQDFPIGIAYLLLKNKLNEIELLYKQQVQIEFEQHKQEQEQVVKQQNNIDNQEGQE